jgi:hypothetical protein
MLLVIVIIDWLLLMRTLASIKTRDVLYKKLVTLHRKSLLCTDLRLSKKSRKEQLKKIGVERTWIISRSRPAT